MAAIVLSPISRERHHTGIPRSRCGPNCACTWTIEARFVGVPDAQNFKLVSWAAIVAALGLR